MLLSIIIPVYKAEEFLPRCLDSVFSQAVDPADYEVISVNDGSPDRSLEILRRYEAEHPNMVVIDKPNGGVSTARNAGLDIARGEYIMFIDPDDYLMPNLDYYLQIASQDKLDLIIGSCHQLSASGQETAINVPEKKSVYGNREVLDTIVALPEIIYCVPWTKLYRRDVIANNSIRFKEGLNRYQDAVFNFQVYPLVHNLRVDTMPLYMYNYHLGNSNNRFFGDKNFEYRNFRYQSFYNFYSTNFSSPLKERLIQRGKEQDAFICLSMIYALYRNKNSDRLFWLSRIFEEAGKTNPDWLKPFTYQVPKLIAKVGPISLPALHCLLWSIFTADKFRKKLRKH